MKKIKIGFFVIYESAFPGTPLLDLMSKDERFEVKVIVAPDVARGQRNMVANINEAKNSLSSRYINVSCGYDQSTNKFIDYSDGLDYACICNPYEDMTHRYFTSKHLQGKGVKTFYLNYTYSVTNYDRKNFSRKYFAKFWKIFLTNHVLYEELKDYGFPTDNYQVIGYPKMDALKALSDENKPYKTIILAPHHTVGQWNDGLNIGSFEKFSKIYYEIPQKFPDILFIFRPHPLFLTSLQKNLNWSTEKIIDYLKKITDSGNTIIDTEPDYLEKFRDSDALIHDCASFVAEYLYTDKPCCYLVRSPETGSEFNKLGRMCFDVHYHASCEEEIYKFIEDVVINKNDPLLEPRRSLASQKVMINHPNSSEIIVKSIIDDFNK